MIHRSSSLTSLGTQKQYHWQFLQHDITKRDPAVTRVTRDLIFRAPNWGCLLTDQKTDCRLSLCGDQYKLHKPYMNYIFSYQFNIFGPCDINTGTYQMMTQVERASWRLPITRLGWNIKLFIRFTDTFLKVGGGEELHIYQTSVPWV